MNQFSTGLSAQLKLQIRHYLEWHTLSTNQRKTWTLVREAAAQQTTLSGEDRVACYYLKKQETTRLVNLMARQRVDRDQLAARHQQEKTVLEQVLDAHQRASN